MSKLAGTVSAPITGFEIAELFRFLEKGQHLSLAEGLGACTHLSCREPRVALLWEKLLLQELAGRLQ